MSRIEKPLSNQGRACNDAQDVEALKRIESAVAAEQIDVAADMARRALASGIEHAQLYNLRSWWHEKNGRDEDALADIKRAVGIAQDKVSALIAYGAMLEKLNRQSEALRAYSEATKLAPSYPEAQFRKGWAELTTGSLEKARQTLHKVLDLDANHLPSIANLADIAYRHGENAEARQLAERALALRPGHMPALLVLARVATAECDFNAARSYLDAIAEPEKLGPLDQANIGGAKADLLHALGRFDEAYDNYAAANALKRDVYKTKFDRDGKENAQSHLDWMIEYYRDVSPTSWQAQRGYSPSNEVRQIAADKHVFLVGFPRSGTTLLENVLGSHSEIESLDEKGMMFDAFETFMSNDFGRDRLANARMDELEQWRIQYWRRVKEYGIDARGKVFVDKHPLVTLRLMIVAKLFPDAKIIFALRDPRDVVLSCFRRSFNMNFSLYPFLALDSAARYYSGTMELAGYEKEKFGLDWHYLRHESLVDDFENELRKVCEFIGVPWSDEMHQFVDRAKAKRIATPSSLQVMKGINREGLGVWRNYAKHLEPIFPILDPWIKEFGYEPS